MPGGLQGVEQSFTADASGYLSAIRQMIEGNRGLVSSVRDTMSQVADAQAAPRGAGSGTGIAGNPADLARQNQAIRETLASLKEYRTAVSDSGAAAAAAATSYEAVRSSIAGVGDAHIGAATQIRGTTEALQAHSGTVADTFRSYGLLDQTVKAQQETARSYAQQIDDLRASLMGGADAGTVLKQALQIRDADVASLGTVRDTAKDATSALAGTAAAVTAVKAAASGGGPGGSATANILGDALAARFLAGSQAAATSSPWAPSAAVLAAMAARNAGSGGGGGGGGFLGGAGAAAGGGGGGGGGFVPWAGGGAAAVRFWGMAAAEVASTVVPALVAAGAAAAVSAQGAEQLQNRFKSIYATSEALGPSLGKTAGSFLGVGSALQQAQNLAGGGTYELAGAGINIARSGAGGGFLQLGLNTVNMLDRAAAGITAQVQGGAGKGLSGLVAGGTGYLQQFGDVGANLGKTLLNTAPYLPGVGSDLLAGLAGGTGALAGVTSWMGPALGPLLAYEAASRWGPALLGGQGLIGRALGLRGVGGLSGLTAKAGGLLTDAGLGVGGAAATDTGISAGGGLLSRLLLRGGGALGDAGLALGAIGAPELGAIGGLSYMMAKGITYQDPFQQWAGGLVSDVGQQGLVAGIPGIISGMRALSRVGYTKPDRSFAGAANYDLANLFQTGSALFKPQGQGWGVHPGALVSGVERGISGFWHEATGGTTGPTNFQVAQQQLQTLSHALVDSFGAGAQVQDQWKKLSGSAIGMGKAFDVATMAQLQLGSAFEKNGKLTSTAKTMIADLYAGYAPMNMNTGQFGAAVGAQTAMSGLQHTQVASVNQAYDQLTQLVSGGAAGTAAYSQLLTAMPKGSGGAMRGYLSPASASAWTAFASTSQPSVLSQLQQQTDWLRQAQTMGALSPGQTTKMAGFLLGQALPSAKGSPAALAMLSTIGQQYGGPAFTPGTSAAQMYKQMEAFAKQGYGAGGYTGAVTSGTEKMANIGTDAQQFVQQIGSGIGGALAQGIADHGAQLQGAFMGAVGGKAQARTLGKYDQFLAGSGVPLKGAQDMIQYAAKLSGATPAQINAMMGQVKKDYTIDIKATADISPVRALMDYIQGVHGKNVKVSAAADYTPVQRLAAEIAAVQSKSVTIDVTEVLRTIGSLTPVGGVASGTLPGSGGGMRLTNHASGWRVPGYGGGDKWPAWLEGGEAVVPKELTPQIAPFLSAHGVPGFAGGMIPSAMAGGGGLLPVLPVPAVAQRALDALLSELAKAGAWKQAGVNIVNGITYSLNGTGSDAAKVGKALVAHSAADARSLAGTYATAMNYARSTAAATTSGLNLAGMDVTPGTGNGTIQQQMQSYLGTVQSFTKDLGALSKGGLSKTLAQQIIAAGPVQGDALAQSALNGYGGVGAVNKLWGQIGKASNALGAQAGMSVYGSHLNAGLTGGTVTNNSVTVNVTVPGGASGDLNLTAAQIKTLTETIQAKLLQQARRNPKTGVKLAGKSA